MAKWATYIDCEGVTHNLHHFHECVNTFRLPPTIMRPNCRDVIVRTSFGIHCFTRDPFDGEEIKDCHIYHRNKEGRLFCPDRWAFGRDLPRIIATILERNCFETDRKNHVLFSAAQTASGEEYAVFFTLTRATDAAWEVNMVVLSAHPRKSFRPLGKPKKFKNLLRSLL